MTDCGCFLDLVSARVLSSLAETSFHCTGFNNHLLWGKRLRARMAHSLGQALPLRERVAVAAAVELFHTATLLHDDVIDGALVRRGFPADCYIRGATASVLLGDRFIVQCLKILEEDIPRSTHRFVEAMGEICDAEIEHEALINRAAIPDGHLAVIARRKTGGLFAFVGWACGGECLPLASALESCGYALGLAYQFADDRRDGVSDTTMTARKTLGTDRGRGKPTLISVHAAEIAARIACELRTTAERLSEWPQIARAWKLYVDEVAAQAAFNDLLKDF
jgi:octaprenyl-diphosphate synthase